jgi:hypothetical protein
MAGYLRTGMGGGKPVVAGPAVALEKAPECLTTAALRARQAQGGKGKVKERAVVFAPEA